MVDCSRFYGIFDIVTTDLILILSQQTFLTNSANCLNWRGGGEMGEFEEWLKVCIVFLGLDSQGSPCVDFRIWGCYKSGFSTITLFKILVSVQNSLVRFHVHVQTSLLIAHDCTWLPPFAMTGLRESLVDTCRWCRWWTPASPFSLLAGKSSDCDWGDSHLIWTIKK